MPVSIKDAKVITYAIIQIGTGNEMPGESIIKSFKEKNDGYKNLYYNNYYLPVILPRKNGLYQESSAKLGNQSFYYSPKFVIQTEADHYSYLTLFSTPPFITVISTSCFSSFSSMESRRFACSFCISYTIW